MPPQDWPSTITRPRPSDSRTASTSPRRTAGRPHGRGREAVVDCRVAAAELVVEDDVPPFAASACSSRGGASPRPARRAGRGAEACPATRRHRRRDTTSSARGTGSGLRRPRRWSERAACGRWCGSRRLRASHTADAGEVVLDEQHVVLAGAVDDGEQAVMLATSSRCSSRNQPRKCSPTARRPRARSHQPAICSVTFFSCARASATGSRSSANSTFGARPPG